MRYALELTDSTANLSQDIIKATPEQELPNSVKQIPKFYPSVKYHTFLLYFYICIIKLLGMIGQIWIKQEVMDNLNAPLKRVF